MWVILVGILVAGGLIVALGVLVYLLPLPVEQEGTAQSLLTVIPAPTPTATPTKAVFTPTPTTPPSIDGIYVGGYVQISGTDGAGLRLRSGPGTSNSSRLLGMDAEVFQVKDGPQTANNFTWWFIESPYDPERSGWAASEYLRVVNQPTASP